MLCPHPLAVYADIRNLLDPGSLPQDFLIPLFAGVDPPMGLGFQELWASSDSFCLVTAPPSLSYPHPRAIATQPRGRKHLSLWGEQNGILVNFTSQYLQNLPTFF